MPTFPVRRLGAAGVVPDVHPADLENPAAFTAAVNVRFRNGRVSRAPMARSVIALPFDPGHLLTIPPSSGGYDEVIIAAWDFSTIRRLNGAVLEDLGPTPALVADATIGKVITSCFLGGVSYINRADTHEPLQKPPGGSSYALLPGWDPTWRCRVLRAYKDQLIALAVTKSGTTYPTMVKWSDIASFGAPPASWDAASTTNSAGENIVNGMTTPLVDGLELRDSFVLYCTGEVWLMDYVGGDFLYTFRKLFDDRGAISPNCAVQVGGSHFVFDQNDIYVHDGVAPRSIADGRVREFIFGALDASRAHLCFVDHDPRLSEVRFCYPSADRLIGFQFADVACNRAAVYSYANDTWTFDDLPQITSAARGALVSGDNWDTDQAVTWDAAGGQFNSSEGDQGRHSLMVGRSSAASGISVPRLFGYELVEGGTLPLPPEPETIRPAFVERIGLDLDSLGKDLTQYVHLQTIWPQASLERPADAYWQFGATDFVNREPLWSLERLYDPEADQKIDIRESGKYLGYRFGCRGISDFKLSGFDAQIVVRGRR